MDTNKPPPLKGAMIKPNPSASKDNLKTPTRFGFFIIIVLFK